MNLTISSNYSSPDRNISYLLSCYTILQTNIKNVTFIYSITLVKRQENENHILTQPLANNQNNYYNRLYSE